MEKSFATICNEIKLWGSQAGYIIFLNLSFVICKMEVIKAQHLSNHAATLMLREDLFKQLIPEQDLKDEKKSDYKHHRTGCGASMEALPAPSCPDHHVALPQTYSLPIPPLRPGSGGLSHTLRPRAWGPGARLRRPSGPQDWGQGEKKKITDYLRLSLHSASAKALG